MSVVAVSLKKTKSAGKPPSRTSCSPRVGASACVARVETPKRPRAAYRRPSGANSAASVDFFLQAEDGIRDVAVTGVQTCALPIYANERIRGISEKPADAVRLH